MLSPYLKFGCLSARTFYWQLNEIIKVGGIHGRIANIPKGGEIEVACTSSEARILFFEVVVLQLENVRSGLLSSTLKKIDTISFAEGGEESYTPIYLAQSVGYCVVVFDN